MESHHLGLDTSKEFFCGDHIVTQYLSPFNFVFHFSVEEDDFVDDLDELTFFILLLTHSNARPEYTPSASNV
jgi:hypothetical protein